VSAQSRVYDLAAALRDCVADTLEASATAGLPERVCVVPGAIAWDDCQCGQLAVTVTRLYPSNRFPQELSGQGSDVPSRCGAALLGVDLTVQVVRCAPSPTDADPAVACAALEATAQMVLDDAYWTRVGVVCCLRDLEDETTITDWLVRAQTPAGPQGGCVGSDLAVTVAVPYDCPCGEPV
jgi:hypothetical protein